MTDIDTSQLACVNTMLSLIGESPVNSLAVTDTAEVAMAVQTISEVSKELQVRGWQWNTEMEYKLTADSNSQYPWQPHWVRFDADPDQHSSLHLVRRGEFLYDTKTSSNVISASTVTGTLVIYLDWDDLPEAARNYIQMRSSRKFQDRILGDESRHGYSRQDEEDAWALLMNEELQQGDYNILRGGAAAYVVDRLGGGGIES